MNLRAAEFIFHISYTIHWMSRWIDRSVYRFFNRFVCVQDIVVKVFEVIVKQDDEAQSFHTRIRMKDS